MINEAKYGLYRNSFGGSYVMVDSSEIGKYPSWNALQAMEEKMRSCVLFRTQLPYHMLQSIESKLRTVRSENNNKVSKMILE